MLCASRLGAACRLCSKVSGRVRLCGNSNALTPAQQGAAPDRLQPCVSLVPRFTSGFRQRVSLVVGRQRLRSFTCAVSGLLSATFWLVFSAFHLGDVLLSAFLAGFSITFWFSGALAFQHRRGFLGFGSRNFVGCCPTRRCTRLPTVLRSFLTPVFRQRVSLVVRRRRKSWSKIGGFYGLHQA